MIDSRYGDNEDEPRDEDDVPPILERLLKFDDVMSEMSIRWREHQQLLDAYTDAQVLYSTLGGRQVLSSKLACAI